MKSKEYERGILQKWVSYKEMEESISQRNRFFAVLWRDESELCDRKWGRNGRSIGWEREPK